MNELKELLLLAYWNVCVELYPKEKDEYQAGINKGIKIMIKAIFKRFFKE